MTFRDLQEEAASFAPALWLDAVFPYVARHIIKIAAGMLSVLLGIVTVFFLALDLSLSFASFVSTYATSFSLLFTFQQPIVGGFFIVFGVWLFLMMLDGYYFSLLLSSEAVAVAEHPHASVASLVTVDIAAVLLHTNGRDITAGFLTSSIGKELLVRCGIAPDAAQTFLTGVGRRPLTDTDFLVPEGGGVIDVSHYTRLIVSNDAALRSFFHAASLTDTDVLAAASWLEAMVVRVRRHRRWWSRDMLGRVSSLGTSFSYGRAYVLEKFGTPVTHTSTYRLSGATLTRLYAHEIELVETVLVRERGANAVIVGEDPEAPLSVVAGLARLIEQGKALSFLAHKQLFLLDASRLTSVASVKAAFELSFQKLLAEADRAGNIILVIPHFTDFVASATTVGADALGMLEGYLRSSDLHVVALIDADSYHREFERNAILMEQFETVLVAEKGDEASLSALERIAERIEQHHSIIFSYPALKAAFSAASRAFSDAVPLDKASDLLLELTSSVASGSVVSAGDVGKLVEAKTGIPSNGPGVNERARLLKLEELLHVRVVGQNEAISSIAGALRRARAGLANPNRPLGSFLFLGPTGVGKTETAKALAEVFFHDERAMIRFDMSEFSGTDGLEKLIGSAKTATSGILASRLRETPYAVLLLDEFEKSSPAVRDLFLQILDEGYFSDAHGKRVGARSTFIIATSNAASAEIFRLSEAGEDVAAKKSVIIDAVVASGMFRPELINRFDAVIVFRPVSGSMAEAVSKTLLLKFAKRIAEKGYELVVNDVLVQFISRRGIDPKFGARPLNRAIEDTIEQAIADKIIMGDLKPGARIEFLEEDLEKI